MAGTRYPLEVRPVIPQNLRRLEDLASNLFYSWDRRTRALFRRIDTFQWEQCEHNPTVFLRRVPQARFDALAEDSDFLQELNTVMAAFDQYLEASEAATTGCEELNTANDTIAYFCMEYGLHESLQLYSGGLGILAGDHCKAASDLGLPFVAVGLMYRQGYFTQRINAVGEQEAVYNPVELADLPVRPATTAAGDEVCVRVPFPGRAVEARVWEARVGHVRLYLLDTELPANAPGDRSITYQLYGGDRELRMAQEMVLGIGGVRALRALGIEPTVWHLNEGHPAFGLLERCREQVAVGLDFESALQLVAAATVFTTHTPVAAGHDLFAREMVTRHFREYVASLGTTLERFLELGMSPDNHDHFNMTALALRGSRRHNGVSRIHGEVAARMEHYIWPQVPPAENPLQHITNGVHIPTFLAREWLELFDAVAPGWRSHVREPEFWAEQIEQIPDSRFRSIRQLLKGRMLEVLGERLTREYERRQVSRSRIRSLRAVLHHDNTRPLVIGFARRFATYKRALLLFRDPERLARLLGDPERPVIVLFGGKAHPADEPGQALIHEIVQRSAEPPFRDRVFFIEGYGMTLARALVAGVDVWLNTPEYPLEASGTSGQKAAMNGSVNLSVLDGWWAEGYDGENGWGIAPHDPDIDPEERDAAEAEELLDLLEYEVIPTWFDGDGNGLSEAWVQRAKASMLSILPRFNAQRMLVDYVERMYAPACAHGRTLGEDGGAPARKLAHWKQRVRERWSGVALRWLEPPPTQVHTGGSVCLRVGVQTNGLAAEDLHVECVLELPADNGEASTRVEAFTLASEDSQEARFEVVVESPPNGLVHYRVRACPTHPHLAHPFETGCMTWL